MKKIWISVAVIIFTMFILPFAAVKFAPEETGLMICFMLFFVINPMLAVGIGIFTGRKLSERWYVPIVMAGTYLISSLLLLDMNASAFIVYDIAYLALCGITMITLHVARSAGKKFEK